MKIVRDFSDLACLERLRDNDVRAFDQLFDQFALELCRFAQGHLKSQADAEDMVQDCFLKVWERRHEFDNGIVFKTYLYTTVYHAILKQLRRQRYWVFEECGEETLIEQAGPGRAVEYQELEQFYQVALDQLPPRRREIFTLSRQQGLPNASIAKELNISVKCVENQMSHALKFLKLYFHAHGMSLALLLLFLSL